LFEIETREASLPMKGARTLSFLATWNDSWDILTTILADSKLSISPDRWYEDTRAEVFTEITPALKQMLRERPRAYIWSSSYTAAPPILQKQNIGPKAGSYFIHNAKGGPGIELVLPACFVADGTGYRVYEPGALAEDRTIYLNYGALAYPKEIEDARTGQWSGAPDALIAGFRDVVKRIQSRLAKDGKNWVGKEGLALLRAGKAQIFVSSRRPQVTVVAQEPDRQDH
jgi:hypothetical protein